MEFTLPINVFFRKLLDDFNKELVEYEIAINKDLPWKCAYRHSLENAYYRCQIMSQYFYCEDNEVFYRLTQKKNNTVKQKYLLVINTSPITKNITLNDIMLTRKIVISISNDKYDMFLNYIKNFIKTIPATNNQPSNDNDEVPEQHIQEFTELKNALW
jgi:hypothetical protein